MAGSRRETGAARYAVLREPGVLDWLERELRARLQLSSASELSFEFPAGGLRTPVAIAHGSDGTGAVLKLFRRLGGLGGNVVALRHLNARGLPVPRLHCWSVRARFAAPRHYLTIEERVAGHTIEDVPAEQRATALAAIARALAAFHSARRRWRGRPALPRPGGSTAAYLPRVLERLQRLTLHAPDGVGLLTGELRRSAAGLDHAGSWVLLHGRVNRGNVLIDDTRATWIDLGSVHYGEPARDLVRALHRLCNGPDEARAFLGYYLPDAPAGAEDRFARAEAFYACDYLLLETGRQVRLWSGDDAALRETVAVRLALCSDLLHARGPRFHEAWPKIW